MGGGGGTGGYTQKSLASIRRKLDEARAAEQQRLDESVNDLLRDVLARFNDRDAEETRVRIDQVRGILGEVAEIDALMFGGSVAKHTYVDGLSDVDALVVLDRRGTQGYSPQKALDDFYGVLQDNLPGGLVSSVRKGELAVTIEYRDGGELQLLPAVRKGSTISIPKAGGAGWKETDPKRFQRELTRQNDRLNRALVPTIKLMKSLVADLPEQQRISGYHTESLCLDAVSGYRGPRTPRALLIHVLDHASKRVLKPIQDVTGQSRTVDADLGKENSTQRRLASQALSGVKRRLEAATSRRQWAAMFGRVEE